MKAEKYSPQWCAEECFEASSEFGRLHSEISRLNADLATMTNSYSRGWNDAKQAALDAACGAVYHCKDERHILDVAIADIRAITPKGAS